TAGIRWNAANWANWICRPTKNAVAPTNRPSSRSRPMLSNAALISSGVSALKTWTWSPKPRAAVSTSRNVVSATRSFGRIDQDGQASRAGRQLTQQLQPLRRQINCEKSDAGEVAARPGEARDQTAPGRIVPDRKDDGDCRGRRLGRECTQRASACDDHGDVAADQFARQRRQPVQFVVSPAVFDREVLALDIAGVLEALAESAQPPRIALRRLGVYEPDHGYRPRPGRERPSRRRAAEQRDEVASSQVRHAGASPPCANADHGWAVGLPRIQGITERRQQCSEIQGLVGSIACRR